MARPTLAILALGLATVTMVRADPGPRSTPADAVWQRFSDMGSPDRELTDLKDARFAFNGGEVLAPAAPGALAADFDLGFGLEKRTVAFSANGEAAWLAADVATYEICGDETCPKKPRIETLYHATALFTGGPPWQPVFWHVESVIDSKAYAAALARGMKLAPVPDKTVDADEVVALFRSSIGDPAALARTISSRSDVVLYGTDRKERYVGGKAVAATLRKWSLAFTIKDGLAAGVTAGGTVAWVAANVDAVASKKPRARSSPYRVTAIYERSSDGWKIVNLHFSF